MSASQDYTVSDTTESHAPLVLGRKFRNMPPKQRLEYISGRLGLTPEEVATVSGTRDLSDLCNVMVESAVGHMAVPMGIAGGFKVNGRNVSIPMAVEEPSVIAAATYAGSLISRRGDGFSVSSDDPVMCAEIYLRNARLPADAAELERLRHRVREELETPLAGMSARGGGFRDLKVDSLDDTYSAVRLYIDTRDAMGANIVNTAAESVRELVAEWLDGESLMAILTNAADTRTATARFSIPVEHCGRSGRGGAEMAERIVAANTVADLDYHRAVTHNKGIMNGVSSLALATGNDTRAIEAACHAYASRDARYRALTEYWIDDGRLHGRLTLPLAFGSLGGAVGFHPATRFALKVLGSPDSTELAGIAASVGLAQNYAALSALVGEGIQRGHMRLHANRLAWQAGARGDELEKTAEEIARAGLYNQRAAAEALERVRSSR
ncbi:MAG: hydroxymethylglutaryl-CoA reductase, degradative [Spirochaetales bacterium]